MSPVLSPAINIALVVVMLGVVAAALAQRATRKDAERVRVEAIK